MTSKAKTPALSRIRIINAAYQLAKKDPINALSMRKIATKLKVTPMAIYKYFDDKNALTTAVIDMHLKKSNLIPMDIDPESDWRTWVKASFLRMWDAYDSAPGMIQYMSNATSLGPAVLDWQNEVLKVLINAGFTPQQAGIAHIAMTELAAGSTILAPIRRQNIEQVFPITWSATTDTRLMQSQPDNTSSEDPAVEYPWLLMCKDAVIEYMENSRSAFSSELDLLLNGLEASLPANKS